MYERERIHAECEENETACASYAYRKTTILKSMLIKSMPGYGWGLCERYRIFGFYK